MQNQRKRPFASALLGLSLVAPFGFALSCGQVAEANVHVTQAEVYRAKIVGALGDLPDIAGPRYAVMRTVQLARSLRDWSEDAERCFELYRKSQADGDRLIVEKCVRDINTAATRIIAACEQYPESDLREVSNASELLRSYVSYANALLQKVSGR